MAIKTARKRRLTLITTACVVALVVAPLPAFAAKQAKNANDRPELSLIDTITVPAGTTQLGTPFGGISGIDYRTATDSYVAISDDRSENAPARFYDLRLPIVGDEFAAAGLQVTSVTQLRDPAGATFARRAVDPEAIRVDPATAGVIWTSEGAASNGIPPAVKKSGNDGIVTGELALPTAFIPQFVSGRVVHGARDNQSLESLATSPDGKVVTTAVENALVQDGPAASLNAASPSRIVRYDRATGAELAEYVYEVDPVLNAPTAPLPAPINTYSADRGLSDLVALNATDYLAVERSFASGVGYRIKVYWTSVLNATDVKGTPSLAAEATKMVKRLVFDFATTDVTADNVEGITWGPNLANGDRSLILAVDDNFGFLGSATRFHLLRVPVGSLPVKSIDVNGDGNVTGRDLGLLASSKMGDLDGDGKRNAADVLLWNTYAKYVGAAPASDTVDLQLLSFNDFHGNLQTPTGRDATLGAALDPSNSSVGGAEYLASTLTALRNGAGPSLTVAAGDIIGASPLLSGLFHDEPTIESMEALGLNVTSVGNHEFDEGVDELLRIQNGGCHPVEGCYDSAHPYDGTAYPILAANVVDKTTREPILAPSWVREVDGVKVGFIGMTLEGTREVTGASGVASVDFLDEVETANAAAAKLNDDGVHAIIVLLHEGGKQTGSLGQCVGMSGPVVQIAQNLDARIDAVVTGHTHQPYICKIADPNGVDRLVTSASSFGRVVTEARIPIDRNSGDVVRSGVEARNHLVLRSAGKDAAQTAIIDRWSALAAPLANRIVGTISADIVRSETRDRESDLANLVADAQLAATQSPEKGGAQIALMNPGGVRADLSYAASAAGELPGQITYAEAYAVQPFAGSLVSVDLTGAQIEKILEEQFNDSGTRAATLILGVSKGFEYAYTASRPVGDRIDPSSIKLNGVVLDLAATYRVTANTFLADGGDGFITFAQGTNRLGGGDDIVALTDYLGANSPIAPPGVDRATELP